MKIAAIGFNDHGGHDVVRDVQIEIPDTPAPGCVRVRPDAASLSHLDLWFRRGVAQAEPGRKMSEYLKLKMPHVLGSDVAGTVESVGAGVAVGIGSKVVVAPGIACGNCESCAGGRDNVCRAYKMLGEFAQGSFADFVDVPVANVFSIPSNLTVEQIAGVPLVFLVAWNMIVEKARLQYGESVLIHAAGSGVSSAAIQIAKCIGATVIATTANESKVTRAKEVGAHEVVDTSKADFVAEVRRITNKRGVDVVLEHLGGEVFTRSVTTLGAGGRLVTCGQTTGSVPGFDSGRLFMRGLTLQGCRAAPKAALHDILRRIGSGIYKPVTDRVLPFTADGAREAHRLLESREAFGKIVLARA